jgi:hypothetical protein
MRWMRNLLSASRNDPISGWLVGSALVICPFAIWYGVAVDRNGFLVNLAASLALVGPGLFITNRVARNWNARRFRPIVEELPKHFSLLLRRLASDFEKMKIVVDNAAPPVINNNLGCRRNLELLAIRASEWASLIDNKAQTARGDTSPPRVEIELTVGRAVDHLERDVDRLDVAVGLPELARDRERVKSAATEWDGYRLAAAPNIEVLLTGKTLLEAMRSLACKLGKNLPKYLQ